MEIVLRNLQTRPVNEELMRRAACEAACLTSRAPHRLSLVLVDDERIQEINREFRGQDQPTDVIAFEPDSAEPEAAGEVIVSVEAAQRQAEEAQVPTDVELAWLVAHGVLHTAGMEDATPAQLEAMLAVQRQALAAMGLQPP